jgi:TRAP-type uncharacterized transport system substrate-binding protein
MAAIPVASGESAQSARTEVTTLVLGTATPGGGFQLFGQTLADVINAIDPSLRIETVATQGSSENLTLLEAGAVDIGLVEGNAAHNTLQGLGRTSADLKVVSVMYPNLGMFVVRADSPYQRIDSVGLWSLILTRPQLPDALAYRLAEAIHRGAQPLSARLAQGRFTTMQNTATQVPAEHLHPGVVRYLREQGSSD